MVPRAMDKRGKHWTFLTEEQENERVELATNVGSIPIARSTSSVDLDSALFRESEDVLEVTLEESGDAER